MHDYCPEDDIRLPPNQYAPAYMPTIAWQKYGETRSVGLIRGWWGCSVVW